VLPPLEDFLLGKKPPLRSYGEIRAKVANFMDSEKVLAGMPDVPDTFTWAQGVKEPFPMFLNDEYGDCTCATQGQEELIQSHRVGSPEVPSDSAIFELYNNTGVEQGLTNEDGRYHEGVLSYRKRVGLRQADGTYEKILGYAAVNWLDREEIRAAGYIFGGLQLCVALPEAAYYQMAYGQAHDVRPRWVVNPKLPDGTVNPGSWAPGSWGGHAIYVPAAMSNGYVLMTWGQRVFFNGKWLAAYGDEMYVTVSADWARMPAPSGFDQDGLLNLLHSL